jgi:hypothetical protein
MNTTNFGSCTKEEELVPAQSKGFFGFGADVAL